MKERYTIRLPHGKIVLIYDILNPLVSVSMIYLLTQPIRFEVFRQNLKDFSFSVL